MIRVHYTCTLKAGSKLEATSGYIQSVKNFVYMLEQMGCRDIIILEEFN